MGMCTIVRLNTNYPDCQGKVNFETRENEQNMTNDKARFL